MKTIIILILSFSITAAYAQSPYEKMITERVAELDTARTSRTLQRLANDFERIALADEKNWLAHYYTAYSYVRLAYSIKGDQIDVYCNQAETYLKTAEKLQPKNSEILALYAYLYGAKVNVSPMLRGASMGKKSAGYTDLAIEADPENPRPYLIRAMGIYHTPKAFGGGAEKAVPYLEKALGKYKTFTPASKNAPRWGKAYAEQLLRESLKK